MPYPSKDETEEDFVSRCMGSKEMNKKHPDQKQRAAICYSLFKESKKDRKKK